MSFHRSSRVITLAACFLAACAAPTDNSQKAQPAITALPRPLSTQEQIAASATSEFGLALFRSANASSARDMNLALSPVSASLALGMLMNGAEGQTFDEIRRTLGFGTRTLGEVNTAYRALIPLLASVDPSVTMKFANAAWFDLSTPSSTTFAASITDAFAAKVAAVPLASPATVKTINDWASANTNGRIPTVVDAIDPTAVAVLLNATYFKGKWRSQFDAAATHSAPFHVSASRTEQLPMMSNQNGLARTGGLADGTIIGELPYGGDAFVMDVILPPLGAIEASVDALTTARLRSLIVSMTDSAGHMLVELPKFRLETSRELAPTLISLGMPRVFGAAQLDPMFARPAPGAAVSSVLQKVFVDVNEEGTEAAAVTAITVRAISVAPHFVVDRPFIFLIRERFTGTVLFIGKVVRPVAP